MSYEKDSYGFTYDERIAGLNLLMNGKINKIDLLATKYNTEQQKTILLISGLSENKDIKNTVIKEIFNNNLDEAINIYTQKENLPLEYVKIAKLNNGLEILLKSFLKNTCFFTLDNKILLEIDNLIKYVYTNKDNHITYYNVKNIQIFLHKCVEDKYGKNTHLDLDKQTMKHILSSARLHLEIHMINYNNHFSCFDLLDKSIKKRKKEKKKPSRPKLLKGQKYVPYWRIQHFVSIIEYIPSNYFSKIEKINKLKIIQSVQNYRYHIVQIFK